MAVFKSGNKFFYSSIKKVKGRTQLKVSLAPSLRVPSYLQCRPRIELSLIQKRNHFFFLLGRLPYVSRFYTRRFQIKNGQCPLEKGRCCTNESTNITTHLRSTLASFPCGFGVLAERFDARKELFHCNQKLKIRIIINIF